MRSRLAILASLGLVSCTIGAARFDELMREKVVARAQFDFDCPGQTIDVVKIHGTTYGAKGCGKRATYMPASNECSRHLAESIVAEHCQIASDLASQSSE
jgi:hypothetical protein